MQQQKEEEVQNFRMEMEKDIQEKLKEQEERQRDVEERLESTERMKDELQAQLSSLTTEDSQKCQRLEVMSWLADRRNIFVTCWPLFVE